MASKVKPILVDEKSYRKQSERCERVVRKKPQIGNLPSCYLYCRNVARYEINEKKFCHQHAGEVLLLEALEN